MRAQFQILVIPFRKTMEGLEFAVLKRRDTTCWQFVSGGGEDSETSEQAAQSETVEEIGISAPLIPLDSFSTVPKSCFAAADSWEDDIFVIPQYCFAVNIATSVIILSDEHTEFQWVSYDQAHTMLK